MYIFFATYEFVFQDHASYKNHIHLFVFSIFWIFQAFFRWNSFSEGSW